MDTAPRSARWRRLLVVLALLAGTAIAVKVLLDSSDELFAAADDLTDLNLGWVAAAVAAEGLCYVARGAAQRRLLVSAEHDGTVEPADRVAAGAADGRPYPRARTMVLAGTTLAGDAVAYCLPFGFAAAGVVTLRVLRRRGLGEVLAGWMFGVATALYVAVLAVLAIIAAQLAGDEEPAGFQGVSVGLLLAVVGAFALVMILRRTSLGSTRWARRVATLVRRGGRFRRNASSGSGPVRRWCAGVVAALGRWWSELRRMRLAWPALALASVGMLISWAADVGVLAASYAALGAVPPWSGLLLAYCVGQVVSSVPITPGGIGVVEGSLTLALVAFGGSTETTLAAVLLYRLVSHWACVPAGGLAWLALRLTSRPGTVAPVVRGA